MRDQDRRKSRSICNVGVAVKVGDTVQTISRIEGQGFCRVGQSSGCQPDPVGDFAVSGIAVQSAISGVVGERVGRRGC